MSEERVHNRDLRAVWGWLPILCAVVLWVLLTPRPIPMQYLPSPKAVWAAAMRSGEPLLKDAGATAARAVLGWLLGTFAGIKMGLMMDRSKTIRKLAGPTLELLRPIPPVAFIPFFIAWFGIGFVGQVLLIALSCFMVMTIDSFNAAAGLPPVYYEVARSFGLDERSIYKSVIRPAIAPDLIGGFRISAALAFGVSVAADFIGAQQGLGFRIMLASRTLNTDVIFVAICLLGIESLGFDALVRLITSYTTRWAHVRIPSDKRADSKERNLL